VATKRRQNRARNQENPGIKDKDRKETIIRKNREKNREKIEQNRNQNKLTK
jgi:hypothetical protein